MLNKIIIVGDFMKEYSLINHLLENLEGFLEIDNQSITLLF